MKTQSAFDGLKSATVRPWFSTGLALLRIVLGFQFLLAGIDKFGDWSAEGYLGAATGPFASFFQSMAGSPVIDQLNIWGLTLIGVALILGLAVRPASFFGVLIMCLYYFAQFEQNTAHGYIDQHIVYLFIFVMFMAGGVGHVFGLDGLVKRYFSKQKRLAALFFG